MEREWDVHQIANCTECDWQSEARDAKRRARIHHEKTGHRVTGERGLAFSYDFGAVRPGRKLTIHHPPANVTHP